MDSARRKTDKLLKNLERRISEVYKTDPSLLGIQKEYERYMTYVDHSTRELYETYKNTSVNSDEYDKAKKAYEDEVKRLTLKDSQYRNIVSKFTEIMAEVNQKALDLVNAEMSKIYTLNYNQVAVDCKKVGIKVENVQE